MYTNRIAVVTGGTGGIGTAISQDLSKAGFQVIACYYKGGDHDAAKAWQQKQKDQGYNIDIAYADISNYEDCEALKAKVINTYGRIDVLVNNAGITNDSTFKKMTPEQWHTVLDANLTSVFNMTRNFLQPMLDAGYGRIITISSINGRKGQFGQCNYAATKSALYGFSKSLAQEVASKGITVNVISPGYIKTEMVAKMKPETLDYITTQIPVGRLGEVGEVARMVTFLADDKSGFITGSNFDLNGGQYM
ncbi:acetoacetyl-CoA reductase [Legionella sp. W05-934-2]|jgi:acetoacetyl-CoA reductase|uniref:acetoacetyl-CoA reductase n=1 Tax=Legionella sp. W05-934-2 TaxID=1198649 RepID=UPI00346371D2